MIKAVILTPYSPISPRFPTTKLKRKYMQVFKEFIKDQSGLGQAEGMIVFAVLIAFGVFGYFMFFGAGKDSETTNTAVELFGSFNDMRTGETTTQVIGGTVVTDK